MFVNSLFKDFLEDNGLKVWKEESTRDIICIEFNYGSRSYRQELDYLYKVLLTENLTEKEIKQIYNSIILCNSLRKNLMYQYADNTLFRILFIGIMLRSSTLVMCGYKLCQKL